MSGKWIYIGRRDLMLVHSSGFLTNPVPCESALRPLVVELNWNKVEDESKARANIWKAVEEYNDTVMTWARLEHPEALVILPRGSHLERSDKETIKRAVNLKKFEQEINQGYENWDSAAPLAKA